MWLKHRVFGFNMSNNTFVFLIQVLSLLFPCDYFPNGIWTPQCTVLVLTALPCANCCEAPNDKIGDGAFVGPLDRLDHSLLRGVPVMPALLTCYTYKQCCVPGNITGHGGINVPNNPFVFLIQVIKHFVKCYKSNVICLVVLPCSVKVYAIVCHCIVYLLMLRGDLESNPGLGNQEVLT